ncbi:DUF1854 domain-containing protein [Ruminococcus sp. Marseille-P6503]|uniref:DUF1854 domain-containing protein n=1 Tax=Ruminococcus sp. Marseille-P6503 TaxID=2364796 RepID=UPI000F5334F2|nr:DUF1854 domain-containing protein [Ruminococcus sp. Marseille-P6503]
MTSINTEEVYEVDKLTLLDCSKIKLSKEKSGYLTLEYDGKLYRKVSPTRLVPFISKTTYISLSYENNEKEFREIGVIRDMRELSDEQYNILDSYLEYKYYMPEITKVYSIKDNMHGAIFVKADTTSGEKTICIRDWYQNFRMIGYDYLYVNDADGNKYFCPDIHKLDKKSRLVLEMFT